MLEMHPESGRDSSVTNIVAGVATFLMALGAYILRKLHKTPRPDNLSFKDYESLKKDIEIYMGREVHSITESVEELRVIMESNVGDLRTELRLISQSTARQVASIRGEMQQISLQLAEQGGTLRGLTSRMDNE